MYAKHAFVSVGFLALVLTVPVDTAAEMATAETPQTAKSSDQLAWEARVPRSLREREAFAFVEEDPALPRVLLIGDSISIGYTPTVRHELAGIANVLRIPTNGGSTVRGLESLDEWLGGKSWDVIHFNWGLHDLKYLNEDMELDLSGVQQTPLESYEENLEKLVERLKQTKAKLLWASTTPVPEGASGRKKGDEVLYNAVAARVMREHDIAIDDLYTCVLPNLEMYQRPRNVHFAEEGSAFLGKKVATEIRKALEQQEPVE